MGESNIAKPSSKYIKSKVVKNGRSENPKQMLAAPTTDDLIPREPVGGFVDREDNARTAESTGQ